MAFLFSISKYYTAFTNKLNNKNVANKFGSDNIKYIDYMNLSKLSIL